MYYVLCDGLHAWPCVRIQFVAEVFALYSGGSDSITTMCRVFDVSWYLMFVFFLDPSGYLKL